MKSHIISLFVVLLLFISCEEIFNASSSSVVGRLTDQASMKPMANTTLLLENSKNSYISLSNADGYFEFKDIKEGTYTLISKKRFETSASSVTTFMKVKSDDPYLSEITDTIGQFSTDNTNWGEVYSKTFASITGTVTLSGADDYSEITVKLLGTDKIALTTNNGKFRFDFLFPGTYDLVFEKVNYRKISVKDITLTKGSEYQSDTVLSLVYKMLMIETNALVWPQRTIIDFTFSDGKFWFCDSPEPLTSFDPVTNVETATLWKGTDYFTHPYGLAGTCHIAETYENAFWISGDGASDIYFRKVSVQGNQPAVVDSVHLNVFSSVTMYNFGWDPISKQLVAITGYNNQMKLYDPVTKQTKLVSVDISPEFDPTEYKENVQKINTILFMPDGTLYMTVVKETLAGKKTYLLFKFDGLTTLNLVDAYIFPSGYSKLFNPFSYYNGDVYLNGDKLKF